MSGDREQTGEQDGSGIWAWGSGKIDIAHSFLISPQTGNNPPVRIKRLGTYFASIHGFQRNNSANN
jgi:hypothetical protein